MAKGHESKKYLVWRIIGAVLVVAQVIVSALLLISLIKMGILAQWILWLIAIGLVVLGAICAIPLFIKKKSILVVRILCMILSVLVIAGGIFAYRYAEAFNSFLDRISSTIVSDAPIDEGEKDLTERPFILYISGTDSHTSVDDPNARSDVNILVVVNPDQSKILLASIPRDTYMQLHGTEGLKDKLTHAGMFGVEMSKATLEDFLDIKIDRTLKVSFDTVVKVVDELDGVEIYSDVKMNLRSSMTGKMCYFVEGTQLVDGECALRFSRERKTYHMGDLHRGANQQEVLSAIIKKLSGSKEYLLKAPEILEVAADSFETSLSRDEITAFIKMQLNEGKNWQIESVATDGVESHELTYSLEEMGPLFVFIPNEESVANVKAKINEYLNE